MSANISCGDVGGDIGGSAETDIGNIYGGENDNISSKASDISNMVMDNVQKRLKNFFDKN